MICVIGVEEYTGAHNVGADVRFILSFISMTLQAKLFFMREMFNHLLLFSFSAKVTSVLFKFISPFVQK